MCVLFFMHNNSTTTIKHIYIPLKYCKTKHQKQKQLVLVLVLVHMDQLAQSNDHPISI